MYFNGSLTLEGVGEGVLLISPSGDKLRYTLQLYFGATNNVAEYKALLHNIRAAVEICARHLFIRGDYELVINQVMKESTCRNVKMEANCVEVQKREDKFDDIKLHHVLWRVNEEANSLVRLASSWKSPPSKVFLDVLDTPSICLEVGKVPALVGAHGHHAQPAWHQATS
jgi:ribonuclease HI